MIILDTNVLAALMSQRPEPAVVNWLDKQAAQSIWITDITLFEVRFGLELLPKGKRRQSLQDAFDQLLEVDLENRVLDFDRHSAKETAALAGARQKAGRTVDMRDTQIAGIALTHRASVVTRNVKHFQHVQIKVVDPWRAQ